VEDIALGPDRFHPQDSRRHANAIALALVACVLAAVMVVVWALMRAGHYEFGSLMRGLQDVHLLGIRA